MEYLQYSWTVLSCIFVWAPHKDEPHMKDIKSVLGSRHGFNKSEKQLKRSKRTKGRRREEISSVVFCHARCDCWNSIRAAVWSASETHREDFYFDGEVGGGLLMKLHRQDVNSICDSETEQDQMIVRYHTYTWHTHRQTPSGVCLSLTAIWAIWAILIRAIEPNQIWVTQQCSYMI